MLGGGTFTRQNKVLPGAYINFISAARATATLSERGVATMPLELDWGPDGTVFEVEQEEFIKDSIKIFGYSYSDAKMLALRELFKHATKAFLYRLTSGGEKATNLFATAKYSGTRGNDLKVVVADSVDVEGAYDVKLYMDVTLVDSQTVAKAEELVDNEFVVWEKDAELAATSGTALVGGTNGTVTGASHQKYLDAIESYSFNAMGVCTDDASTKALYAAFTQRMRDKVGTKFQCALFAHAADYEGVINVKNCVDVVPWVVGIEAACAVNASCTNVAYDGELTVDTSYTQAQLEKAIKAGEFVLHSVGTEVRILEDIDSLVTFTDDKNELFQSNQTVRVLDQIATDIASLFNTKYHGKIQNNASGRVSLWSDIVTHHKELEKLGAIENFSEDDVVVSAGGEKKSVSVEDKITVVNAMAQLYMTVVIQ